MGPRATALRSLFGIGILTALTIAGVTPANASQWTQSRPSAPISTQAVPDPPVGPNTAEEIRHANDPLHLTPASPGVGGSELAPKSTGPLTSYNRAGLQKEVFAFAPYWALSHHSTWNYNVISTLAYFGLDINWDGTWIKSGGGYTGYNSQDLIDMVNEAHAAGVRVLLVIKGSGQAPLNDILTVPAERQLVIDNTIQAIANKNLDGVNIDFEGYTSPTYPNIQAGLTQFTTDLSTALHARWPSGLVTIDTYTGSASWDSGLMRIDYLAPVVDAMFIMAYDMSFDNMSGHAAPNAPMTGWTYNDTLSVSQYLTKAPASKIILGVPWYGYRFKTSGNAPYAPTSSAVADAYSGVIGDLACGKQLTRHWDGPGQSPWVSFYSPSSGDPCGHNTGSWEEIYYDDVTSLGLKYNLVNSSGIRGMGIWALGYDGGAPELWSELNTYFSCPATLTLTATAQTTTEFSVGLSGGSCSVRYYDFEQYDLTQSRGWYWIGYVPSSSTSAVVQGYPGSSYQFRARAHSTAGVVSAWATVSTSVNVDATYSHPFKGLYTLEGFGGIVANTSPPVYTFDYWRSLIARSAKALPGTMPQTGAVLDGYGGLHYYGAPIMFTGNPYWRGWDIARDFAFLPDGTGGYVLDGWGGLHPFAVNGHAMPPRAQTTAYFGGHDIARKVVIFSDGTGGYVMDAYGGLHPFGIGVAAPAAAVGAPYWRNWGIARDVALVPGSHGGYVVNAFGSIYGFSGVSPVASPAVWPAWDIARSIWLLPTATTSAPAGYMMNAYGTVYAFGGAPVLPNLNYWPNGTAKNLLGY